MERRLYRSSQDKRLFGVCGGIAQFLRVDSTLVRVGVVILTVCTGIPILLYILLAMIAGRARMNDLDSEIDRLEKRALVQEVYRLREELSKYKGL